MAGKKESRGKATVKKADDAYTVEGNWVKLPDGTSVEEAVAYATGKKKLPAPAKRRATGKPAAKKPKKPGRPSKRTPELAEAICAVVASGRSLHDAAEECGVSLSTIMDWQADDAEFSAQLTRAREKCLQVLEDKLIKVAQMEIDGYRDPEITPTGASLLQHGWEHYYKLLQVHNARFRDRKTVERTGADGKDLLPAPKLTGEQMEEMAERIARVRERLAKERADAAADE